MEPQRVAVPRLYPMTNRINRETDIEVSTIRFLPSWMPKTVE